MRSIALTFLSILVLSSTAHGQEAPPPAPQGPAASPEALPGSDGTRITVEREGTHMTVDGEEGCTTVKVCPGARSPRSAGAAGAPVSPPAPPAVPAPPPPPPPVTDPSPQPPPMVYPRLAQHVVLPPAAEQPRLLDPARTRLGIMGTAEVLGHGDWMVTSRGIVGLLELSVGLGGRFEIGVKTSPVTWFIPDLRFRDSLWMAEIRAQIVKSPRFKLTAELSYLHVAGFHGVRPGLSMKIGNDRVSFHASVGTLLMVTPRMMTDSMDSCIEGPTSDGAESDCVSATYDSAAYDCGGSSKEHRVHPVVHAAMGLEFRLFNHGRLFLEGFAAGSPDSPVVASFVPGIRFHSPNFAVDLGLGVISVGGEAVLPMPVLNFSYRW